MSDILDELGMDPEPEPSVEKEKTNMDFEDGFEEGKEEKKPHNSSFYQGLINKLPVKLCNTPSDAKRNIKCMHCSLFSSSTRKHKRHLLLKHFIRVDRPFTCFCPKRSCMHYANSFKAVQEHLCAVHPGVIKIKTVRHEEQQPDTEEDQRSVSMFSSHQELSENTKAQIIPEKPISYDCQVEGCSYSSETLKSFKLHTTKKHGKKRKLEQGEEGTDSPNVADAPVPGLDRISGNRIPRFKLVKRKFSDEEWSVSRRKKSKLDLQESPISPPVQPKIKQLRVKLNPFLVHFDPVQKALIAMSNVHNNLNQEMSRIDGMMEKLITEHSVTCSECQGSTEFMEKRNQLKDQGSTQNEKLAERIKQLEKELETMTRSFRKLSNQQKQSGEINYSNLLQGVMKPSLRKES